MYLFIDCHDIFVFAVKYGCFVCLYVCTVSHKDAWIRFVNIHFGSLSDFMCCI